MGCRSCGYGGDLLSRLHLRFHRDHLRCCTYSRSIIDGTGSRPYLARRFDCSESSDFVSDSTFWLCSLLSSRCSTTINLYKDNLQGCNALRHITAMSFRFSLSMAKIGHLVA